MNFGGIYLSNKKSAFCSDAQFNEVANSGSENIGICFNNNQSQVEE